MQGKYSFFDKVPLTWPGSINEHKTLQEVPGAVDISLPSSCNLEAPSATLTTPATSTLTAAATSTFAPTATSTIATPATLTLTLTATSTIGRKNAPIFIFCLRVIPKIPVLYYGYRSAFIVGQ